MSMEDEMDEEINAGIDAPLLRERIASLEAALASEKLARQQAEARGEVMRRVLEMWRDRYTVPANELTEARAIEISEKAVKAATDAVLCRLAEGAARTGGGDHA